MQVHSKIITSCLQTHYSDTCRLQNEMSSIPYCQGSERPHLGRLRICQAPGPSRSSWSMIGNPGLQLLPFPSLLLIEWFLFFFAWKHNPCSHSKAEHNSFERCICLPRLLMPDDEGSLRLSPQRGTDAQASSLHTGKTTASVAY